MPSCAKKNNKIKLKDGREAGEKILQEIYEEIKVEKLELFEEN
jgi:hypothetical protein